MPETDKAKQDNSNDSGEISSKVINRLLYHRKAIILLTHIFSFSLSLFLSFLLINNMRLVEDSGKSWVFYAFPLMLLVTMPIKLIVFGLFKQYRGWWRYVGISDLFKIAQASLVSTVIIVIFWYGGNQFEFIRQYLRNVDRHVDALVILDWFATIMILAGLQMLVRMYHEEFRAEDGVGLKRFLIVGAGDAGEALLREIMRMKTGRYDVAGFIDDDPRKQGMSIHGVSVLGTVEELPNICTKHNIEEIAIAIPGANHKELRRVVQICQGTKVRFRTVPSITDIATGKLKVSQIRDVDIADLLGRDEVHLDLDLIENFLKDKVILVTGAGGSIGSEMCRQVCRFSPKQLLLVEQAENPLFFIERELRDQFPEVPLVPLIRNITNYDRIRQVFEDYRPEVVIHAAAHKHVPLMEQNPGEAVINNIIGTKNIADASNESGSGEFVMISTDKAVNPTSIMGSTKRIAEMYTQNLNGSSNTNFTTVRFGNVLDSNGSVVPIFKKQIAAGGPVTVTHPDMERYFMTIPEASQLVLQAATLGKGGEIFVLDMGEAVKIVHLARELITLSGFRPDEDIDIVFSGMRPGEKLFEELSIEGEDMLPTRHPKIAAWQNKPVDRVVLRNYIEEMVLVAKNQDHAKIVAIIKKLIPEYIGDKVNGSN